MTSFATHRRKVHDGALPAHRRMSALRTCLTEFAPYGFRATFHHPLGPLAEVMPRVLRAREYAGRGARCARPTTPL